MSRNELRVPVTGPGVLVLKKWHVPNHAHVEIGSRLCELDYTPFDPGIELPHGAEGGACTDLVSDWTGRLEITVPEGSEVCWPQVIAHVDTSDLMTASS